MGRHYYSTTQRLQMELNQWVSYSADQQRQADDKEREFATKQEEVDKAIKELNNLVEQQVRRLLVCTDRLVLHASRNSMRC